MPLTVRASKSMLRGPAAPAPGPPPWEPNTRGPVGCDFGTTPETWMFVSVSPPATEATPSRPAIVCASDAEKLSCDVETKLSFVKRVPGFPRLAIPIRCGPFSWRSSSCSLRDRLRKPPPLSLIGRVTETSVPRPVSGFSTFACAWSRPRESAETATTSATPTPSPSAVNTVRPLRRRSSAATYEK